MTALPDIKHKDDLPCEEDRIEFLICLALVVASCYDYDEPAAKSDATAMSSSSRQSSSKRQSRFLSKRDDKEEVSMFLDDVESLDESSKQLRKSSSHGSVDSSAEERQQRVQEHLQLAQHRHSQRRYHLACEFLQSATEHLYLSATEVYEEKLLPRLDRLLRLPGDEEASKDDEAADTSSDDSLKQQLEWCTPELQQHALACCGHEKSGFACLGWLLFQHLISTGSSHGYDARIRFWFKRLGVTLAVVMQQNDDQSNDDKDDDQVVARATRKFEALEQFMADRLVQLAAADKKDRKQQKNGDDNIVANKRTSIGQAIWKGVAVTTTGLVAGTLLAVTGGLAAPGIAAGLAALGMAPLAFTVLTVASNAAIVSLFGVAGGSLAAYKMNRRVSGLTEFTIHQELLELAEDEVKEQEKKSKEQPPPVRGELFRTLCISGWLKDMADFQRPWGITPTDPPIKDKKELLERYYQIHNPEMVPFVDAILQKWDGQHVLLWQQLENKYGKDPWDDAFPHDSQPALLSEQEQTLLDKIIVAVGEARGKEKQKQEGKEPKKQEKVEVAENGKEQLESPSHEANKPAKRQSSMRGSSRNEEVKAEGGFSMLKAFANPTPSQDEATSDVIETKSPDKGSPDEIATPDSASEFERVSIPAPDEESSSSHLSTVWDYDELYGGELYTVKWESEVLKAVCDEVMKVYTEFAQTAGREVLKHTVAATLVLAAAVPLSLFHYMNNIDESWTLIMKRADLAGKELARSLLYNKAGNRPVTLVGYSFGARVIYSCLKELAEYQQRWEDDQNQKREEESADGKTKRRMSWRSVKELDFDREPASIVEDAILMGMPKYLSLPVWKACRQVVAGRFVNVYSRQDMILSWLFKYKNILGSFKPVCGICTVAVPGVENIDVSDIIHSHQDYCVKTGEILKRVGLGEPSRESSNAVDEVALLEAAQKSAEGEKEKGIQEVTDKLAQDADIKKLYEAGTQVSVLEQLYSPEDVANVVEQVDKERELSQSAEQESPPPATEEEAATASGN